MLHNYVHIHTDRVKHTDAPTHTRTDTFKAESHISLLLDDAVTMGGSCIGQRKWLCLYVTTPAESQLPMLREHTYFTRDTPLKFVLCNMCI